MSYESERLKILEMIDNGLITVDEGVVLLKALDQRGDLNQPQFRATLEEPQLGTDLESASGKVIFSESAQVSLESSEQIYGEQAASDEKAEGEPVFKDQAAPQAEPVQDFYAEPQPGADYIHTPEPEPPIEEKFSSPHIDQNMQKWKGFWWIPFWVGVVITVLSASMMYYAWFEGGFGFWFACTWFPFMLGVGVMALAYGSRTARWLHVRVHQHPGEKPQNIAISLPIPLRLTAWFFRTFKGHIPQMGNTGIDELIMALEATNPDTPFYVEVDEGEDGERVEVYIG